MKWTTFMATLSQYSWVQWKNVFVPYLSKHLIRQNSWKNENMLKMMTKHDVKMMQKILANSWIYLNDEILEWFFFWIKLILNMDYSSNNYQVQIFNHCICIIYGWIKAFLQLWIIDGRFSGYYSLIWAVEPSTFVPLILSPTLSVAIESQLASIRAANWYIEKRSLLKPGGATAFFV